MAWRQEKIYISDNPENGAAIVANADFLSSAIMTDRETIEQQVTRLYDLHRMSVYKYLMAAFGNATEADDFTQEAFLQLHRALHGEQKIRSVRFWLFRVAHNLAVSSHRHQQFIAPLNAESWAEIERCLPDNGLDPEQKILQREKYERLFDGMKKLTIQERQTLHLRVEGFKYKEIAEIMNVAIPTVNEFLRRGIRKLTEKKQ